MNKTPSIANANSQTSDHQKSSPAIRQSRWQLLVINNTASTVSNLNNQRIDAAHTLAGPHYQLGWSHQVGWHNPLATTPPTQVTFNSSLKIRAPKFLMHSPSNAQPLTTGNTAPADLDKRLIELANQLASDIREPLAAAHRIVNAISHQVRLNSFVSIDDADLLAAASSKLDLVAQWADSVLLTQKIENKSFEIIRSRFTPSQWMESIRETLEQTAFPKRIKLDWIGWDANLPCLYLDANHLTNAFVNLIATAVSTSEPNGTVSIRVNWQNNVTQRLMITIEDSGIALPASLMRILNSSSIEALLPQKGMGLQVARQLITSIGGLVAAQHGSRGGTIIRVSLPVDTYASMIRAWILQNATIERDPSLYRISLFAIRSGEAEAEAFNVHLQKSASIKQFVYRVAENRWLVLELKADHERNDSSLMAAAQRFVPLQLQASQPWLSQSVFNSESFALDGLLGRSDGAIRLPQLTEQLASKFADLLNHQQPAIERLSINGAIIPAPHIARDIPTMDIDLTGSIEGRVRSKASSASDEPGAKTVHEIVKQWKLVQSKLALISQHPAIKTQAAQL